jgi:molybdopterin-containing oxidoreductase family iron-sulfur binding subunit
MDRRTFLKIAGIGSLFVASGCSSEPEKTLFSQVQAPDDMVTGEASWYASTCRECPAGCGILAKNRDGRVVKLEGNPLHPINKGKLCMRGQAALQGLYHPDRIRTPLLKEESGLRAISFSRAESIIREKAVGAAMRGPNRIRMLTEIGGESLISLFTESLRRLRSGGPLVYEPFGYEFLKMANQIVFGINGLISYRIEEADLLVSFGADFLETWLSPVAYARKFNAMHSLREGRKGLFLHISPYQSLTCANADLWLSCNPGSEAIIALGLIRDILQRGRGKDLPEGILKILKKSLTPHTKEHVLRRSGLAEDHYEKLLNLLLTARKPLVLGLGSVTSGINSLQGEIAVNLLNKAARKSEVLDFLKHLEKATVELLLLNNVNPVFTLPSGEQIKEVLERDDLFVVSFSNFMDETTRHADLILPVRLPLENWDEYGGIQGSVSILQPAMGSITGAPQMGDLFIRITSDKEKPFKERGGVFDDSSKVETAPSWAPSKDFASYLKHLAPPVTSELYFIATPSIRFFDGRGANRSWLCEVPDSLSQVSWQTPILVHPDSLKQHDLREGDIIDITSKWGRLEAPVYETTGVRPGILVMGIGQGHNAYGRYAQGMGVNPIGIFSSETEPVSGGPRFFPDSIHIGKTGRSVKLARVAGSKTQHGRKIALSVFLKDLIHSRGHETHGLSMDDFPLMISPSPFPFPKDMSTPEISIPPMNTKNIAGQW